MEIKVSSGVLVDLPYPTKGLLLLTKVVVDAVDYIYRSGFKYSKVEVLLGERGEGFPPARVSPLSPAPSSRRVVHAMCCGAVPL